MHWSQWSPWMDRIRREFGYAEADDLEAARALDELLGAAPEQPVVDWAWNLLSRTEVQVLGAGDAAGQDAARAPRKWPLIAADGATTAAREVGRVPDLVVTDLDGDVEDQLWAARQGSLVFVHAHGDNREALHRWVPQFPAGRVAGTCQVQAFGRLVNPGGFTDGDRACFLAHALGARRVRLLGFDLVGPAGRYTGRHDPARKAAKLAWCGRLLGLLARQGLQFYPPLPPDDSSATQSA